MYSKRHSGAPCVHIAPATARSLCAIEASKEYHRYAVGTYDIGSVNFIQLIDHVEEKNKFNLYGTYSHSGQIHTIESSPSDETLIVTSGSSIGGNYYVNIWKIPPTKTNSSSDSSDAFNMDVQELTMAASLRTDEGNVSSIVNSLKWNKKKDQIITLDSSSLRVWNISSDKAQVSSQISFPSSSPVIPYTHGDLSWDPHSAQTAAVVRGCELIVMDTHNMKETARKTVHVDSVRGVDYNPNKPLNLLTCGHDRTVRLWDLRQLTSPVTSIGGHTHWVTAAKYNPAHDQLIASAGSDFIVNLWRIASCASSPWVTADSSTTDDPPDIKVKRMDHHEDSVHSIAWSAVDAWSFCSLSFDGKVIATVVPTTEKYKILL